MSAADRFTSCIDSTTRGISFEHIMCILSNSIDNMPQQPSDISMAVARASRENWENNDLNNIQDICGL